jgi:hypothetical protein
MAQFESMTNKVTYSRRLVHAGMSGIRTGREVALNGQPLPDLLIESVRGSLKLAAAGAWAGLLLSCLSKRRSHLPRSIACGSLGGALVFAAAFAWRTRKITSSVARSTFREVGRVRDERWIEMNPIDYA